MAFGKALLMRIFKKPVSFYGEFSSETVVEFKDAFPDNKNLWILLRDEPDEH
jgi:hypothetical protein